MVTMKQLCGRMTKILSPMLLTGLVLSVILKRVEADSGSSLVVKDITSDTGIISTDKSLYEVVPKTEKQLIGFFGAAYSHPAVVLWNGVEKIGNPVQFLSTAADMEKFTKEILEPLGLERRLVYAFVKIVMDHAVNQKEAVSTCASNPQSFLALPGSIRSSSVQQQGPGNMIAPVLTSGYQNAATNLLSIKKIPSSDLYSGIYYKVYSKRFPNGLLVVSDDGSVIVDTDAGRVAQYNDPASKEGWAQWIFTPSENSEYYLWENRAFPPPTYITARNYHTIGSTGLDYVTVFSDPADVKERKVSGTAGRESALWKPIQMDPPKYYSLSILGGSWANWKCRLAGVEKYAGSQYIAFDQAGGTNPLYNKGGEWYDLTLFEFIPSVKLIGRVTKLELMEAPEDLLKQKRGVDSTVRKETIANPSSAEITKSIEFTFKKISTFSYGFEQGFKAFASATFEAGIPFIGKGSVTAGFEAELRANQQITNTQEKEYKESTQVKVAPYSAIVVSSYSEWIQDMELPFNATMAISGETLRRKLDTGEDVTGPATGDFIWEYLRKKDSTYDSAQLLEIKADSVLVNVRGKFKGTYGYRGVISTEETVKPPSGKTKPPVKETGTKILTPAEEAKKAYCSS